MCDHCCCVSYSIVGPMRWSFLLYSIEMLVRGGVDVNQVVNDGESSDRVGGWTIGRSEMDIFAKEINK